MAKLLVYLHQRKQACRWVFFALLVLIPLYDLSVERHEAHFIGDRIIGFWSLFGLLVCLVMIVFWKWLAHSFLERDEDYYDN
jgi:glycopeptide antibiotics resistance protein